ncbi:type VII toxin-antitoxin system MntA family adenylyltransferase antitoxin [Natronococcus jeotgali]|uniref:Nucleotidyltransferase protein n=1 Tax=Natronococcus jeotgali DSM 18795 TaxID=1227498 RepID=L9XJR9_9EURY|nr:nucleotidyltransferase domain-containing protein [Natronococcus jeotgali]ELY61676.1 nucleotidyltransferase protein [Natronococcus jeotgali DSM 18795]
MRTWKEATFNDSLPLERLQKVFQEHGIWLAILFGSHASGEIHSQSDIDIAVELEDVQPTDPTYNERFFGLSADLSETLETDAVDLVDLQIASPELAATIFDHGILLVGDPNHATALWDQLAETESSSQSPCERFDAALTKIDEHLSGSAVTATDGETHNE